MILVIDDEERYMEPYIEDLRFFGYKVIWETETDPALKFFEENCDEIKLLILDIMMPPGESFGHEETQKGLKTGVFFYRRIRQKTLSLPIIIITNVSPSTELSNDYEPIKNDNNCWFHRKRFLLPLQLTQEVKRIMDIKVVRGAR